MEARTESKIKMELEYQRPDRTNLPMLGFAHNGIRSRMKNVYD